MNELVEAEDDKVLAKTIARYGRVDLLCIDELGYMELDKRGAELLFQVLTEREEKASVAIATNESFSGWTKTFTDPRLCAAIVDRLTFKAPSSKPAPTPTASPTPRTNNSQTTKGVRPCGGGAQPGLSHVRELRRQAVEVYPSCPSSPEDEEGGHQLNELPESWTEDSVLTFGEQFHV
ncbi:hypothetical protein ACVWZ8_003109 [Arthrobacter sp. UYCu723]